MRDTHDEQSRARLLQSAWPWALAAVVHLAIPLAARVAPLSARLMTARASGALRATLVEVELPREVAGAAGARPDDEAAARAATASVDPRRRRQAPAGGGEVADPGADEAPRHGIGPTEPQRPPGEAGLPPDDYDALPDDGRDAVFAPGVGGRPVWAVPGAIAPPDRAGPAPTTPGPPRAVDKDVAGGVLRGTLAARDKAIGIDLPAAGTVASVLGDAVRTTNTPQTGRATYEVRLGPRGEVLSVTLLKTVGGTADAWERAARTAAARLARKKLAMTGAFASGAIVTVDVASVVQLPAGPGSSSGSSAVKPGPPPGTAGGGMSFDLSNIGAHATRVVSTSFRTRPLR